MKNISDNGGIMISHKYKCIFIHIPKCAGTSIEKVFGHMDGHIGRGGQDHRSIRRIAKPFPSMSIFKNRENLLESFRRVEFQYFRKPQNINNQITLTNAQFNSYFKFTIIRNPWSRAFSWYTAVMRDPITRANLNISENMPFNEVLREHVGKGLLRPQTYWLVDYKGEINFDHIGRFEALEKEFETVCKSIEATNLKLPHKLKGTYADYRAAYDSSSKALIFDVYRDEIDRFNYTFEY